MFIPSQFGHSWRILEHFLAKEQKFQNCHISAGRTNFFKSAVSCDVVASVGVTVYVDAEDFDALNFDVREDVDDGADGA